MFTLQQRNLVMFLAMILIASLTSGCVGGLGNTSTTTVTVSGIVENKSGAEVDYIDVYLDDTQQRIDLKNNQGEFSFEVPAGKYQLWAWKDADFDKKNGVATVPNLVLADKNQRVKIDITAQDLYDLNIVTHRTRYEHHGDVYQIAISPENKDVVRISYGPSINKLQKYDMSTKNDGHFIYPKSIVTGKDSFVEVSYKSKRIFVPVNFMEPLQIISPKNGATVSTPFTIEWHEVKNATYYWINGYKDNKDEYFTEETLTFPVIINNQDNFKPITNHTRFEMDTLDPETNFIVVQAFRTEDGKHVSESMSVISISLTEPNGSI